MLNSIIISGRLIRLARKLATRNWFATARFPSSRSIIIGAAVIGGTALCKIRIKAINIQV
jgi:hypothetical protein